MAAKTVQVDVLIIGAGPAGSSAALDLARAGKTTLLVDRKCFPRDKPCGGALTNKTLDALRYDVTPITRSRHDSLNLSRQLGPQTHITTGGALLTMVTRHEFDHYALDKALQAGASFMQVPRALRHIHESAEGIHIAWEGLEVTAQALLAADGANSQVRKLLGHVTPHRQAFAIEAEVTAPGHHATCFDFDVIPGGYGWVFPKGDHLNIGLYSADRYRPASREKLLDYINRKAPGGTLVRVQGAPIPTHCHVVPVRHGRVCYIGDAAGFCDNLFGEGLYGAVLSAQMAAADIIAGHGTAHSLSRLIRRYRYMNLLARGFYAFMPVIYKLFSLHLDRLCRKTSQKEDRK